jgi:hypothetical protein
MSLKKLVRLIEEFLGADRSALIGIYDRRKNEGSARKPPKGTFFRGVLFTSWLLFAKALRVKSRDHKATELRGATFRVEWLATGWEASACESGRYNLGWHSGERAEVKIRMFIRRSRFVRTRRVRRPASFSRALSKL